MRRSFFFSCGSSDHRLGAEACEAILNTLDLNVQGSEGVKHFLPRDGFAFDAVFPRDTPIYTQKDHVSRDPGD